MPLLTYLMEQDIPGFELSSSYVREYKTQYAAHLLGYTGKLTAEEWATYAGKDYSLDAYVGKDGVEYAFEEYLHGVDGRRLITTDENGKLTGELYTRKPQPGGTVALTIDIDLQQRRRRRQTTQTQGARISRKPGKRFRASFVSWVPSAGFEPASPQSQGRESNKDSRPVRSTTDEGMDRRFEHHRIT